MQLVLYSRVLNSFALAADYYKQVFLRLADTLTALCLGIDDGWRLMTHMKRCRDYRPRIRPGGD
jgi:hypothetical protein